MRQTLRKPWLPLEVARPSSGLMRCKKKQPDLGATREPVDFVSQVSNEAQEQ